MTFTAWLRQLVRPPDELATVRLIDIGGLPLGESTFVVRSRRTRPAQIVAGAGAVVTTTRSGVASHFELSFRGTVHLFSLADTGATTRKDRHP